MSKQVYGWKRFWCSRSGSINLADQGYLYNPDEEWGKVHNPDLVTFETISHLSCLALLGEPGIGKTQALESERSEIFNKIQEQGDRVLPLDLRSYGSEDRLVRSLFDSSEFKAWQTGTHKLYIFLDSFDECLLRVDTLATLLVDEFKRHRDSIHCLCLRIACRTAVWPSVLEEGLKEIWGENSLGIYELAPLRLVDVIVAAEAEGFSPDDFLREVGQKNIVSLAIKPVTLGFLLNIYRSHGGQFPPNQNELYLQGCKLLCEENNESRRGSNRKGKLDVDQRLIVAARIAAITILTNRFAVWTGVNQGDIPADDVPLQKLCHGYETASGREFEITRAVIEETLDTGLFSSRGLHQMAWAHQTYAEFLAAWYLKQRQLKLPQILDLIVHPNDPDNRVIPQLHETVAWLASMAPEVFQKVMETDPDVLLGSDLATLDEAAKAQLIEALLKLHDQSKLAYQYGSRSYEYLKHPELSVQLQHYISNSTRSIHSRYIAIDIAEDCNVQSVQSNLVDVALDTEQPCGLRIRAASAVVCIGDEPTKRQLKRLAFDSQDATEDELKGYALQAVYPAHMTTEEVLSCLTQPRASYIGGCYQDFVAKELGFRLPLTDLPVALEWLLKAPIRDPHYPFRELSDAIILKAWECLEEPEVLSKFAQITFLRLSQHYEMIGDSQGTSFKQLLEKNDAKRRQLLESVISIIPPSETEPLWLAGYTEYSPLTPLKQDFLWLIEKLQTTDSNQIQRIYAKLIRWKLDWSSADQLDALLTASQNIPILQSEFSLDLEPILLNSHRAEQARLEYIKRQEMLVSKNQKKFLDPSPKIRVLESLSQFEASLIDAWWHMCKEMSLTPTSTHYSDRFESDITLLPGWQEADETTKLRIIAAAKNYIYQGDPKTKEWLGKKSFCYSALAGYAALRLLSARDSDYASMLPANVWKKWAAIILDYPNAREDKNREIRQQLIKGVYENAPDESIQALTVLIEQENAQHGAIHIHNEIISCWDERLADFLFSKVQDEKLTARSLGDLLEALLANQVHRARVFAESLVSLPLPTAGEARAKAIIAAQMLMLYAEDAGWSVVWSAIQQDPKFGREVLEAVSYAIRYKCNIEQRLKEDCIADLYIFLNKQYPDAEEDQKRSSQSRDLNGVEAYISTPIDSIKTWRVYIPQRLQELGTPQACEALRKIVYELPELKDKLQWRLLEAEVLNRRQTWQPPTPEEILQLVNHKELPIVKTILILASSPIDGARLRLDKEVREIDEGLRRSQKRDQFKIEQRWAVRTDDLRRALLDTQPHIVHFCGHGAGDAGLLVEDNNGHAKQVSTEALSTLFELCADHAECVLLNACYSEVQADAIVENIAYVIGMSDSIGDVAAIKFSTGFYDALGAGKTIETAYKFGCNGIQLENIPEHLTPRLKKKQ